MADREPPANVRHGRTRVPSEIVFFGRLEERKGLPMFCDAIDVLAGELAARNVSVTFLGKPNGCGGETTEAYLTRRSADWPFATRMLTGLGQPEALDYLRRGDKLAVIASPLDNSPCTVYETLASGVPLLAARTGGIPELIADEDHEHVLFDYEPGALGQALRRALDAGAWVARPAVPPSETHRALLALHEGWRDFLPPPRALPAPTMLAAAVVDHHRGDDLQATLDSLEHCGWFGQVLVLDRDGVATGLGDRRIDLAGTSAHAAAAAILGVPDGPVLLIHSGVAVLPAPFEELLSALQAGPADGLQPAAERRTAAGVVTHVQPLGGSPAFSLFEGPTYTGGMLVHRRALVAALQGGKLVADAAFLGLADLCVAGGADVWPYPRAVLRLPRGLNLGARRSLPARVAAYANAQALDRYYMLAAGYGARSGVPSVSRRREIALALGDSSLALGVRVASRGMRAAREARARVAASKVGSRRRGGT